MQVFALVFKRTFVSINLILKYYNQILTYKIIIFVSKDNWIVQNYVPKNISIIQNTKSPFIFFPRRYVGGGGE